MNGAVQFVEVVRPTPSFVTGPSPAGTHPTPRRFQRGTSAPRNPPPDQQARYVRTAVFTLNMPRRRRLSTVSPAAMALAQAGATQADIACDLGTTAMAVSHWLAGRRQWPPELQIALEKTVGEHDAARVLDLIATPTEPREGAPG
jgi:hypothetical protein